MDFLQYSMLDINAVLEMLSCYAISQGAKSKIFTDNVNTHLDIIEKKFNEIDAAIETLYVNLKDLNFSFDNLDNIISDVKKDIVISISDLNKVKRVLTTSRLIKSSINEINSEKIIYLKQYTENLYTDLELEKRIDASILSDTELADNASVKLKEIRKKIRLLNEKIRQKIISYMTKGEYSQYMQDNLYTIRSDRYVIPVKAEYKSQIKGIVHDQSSTGATVYIEPLEILEINNDLSLAFSEEREEIYQILKNFTLKIKMIADQLLYTTENIIDLDIIFSKAKFAKSIQATRPILTKSEINLVKARHPLIDKAKVVPINIKISKNKNTLIITGSNTGGKTVSLKIVGLFTLMAMLGLYLPCDEGSKIRVVDQIFADIGDEQSIEQSLSTFSSHISRIRDIYISATKDSLVLLDELAMGTDPSEGSALAIAIINAFNKKGSTLVVTTHYHEVKEFALTNKNIQIAAMDFDPKTYMPNYRLIYDVVGSSNAINIAEKYGLDKDIIYNAKQYLNEDFKNFKSIVQNAEIQSRLLEDEKRAVQDIKESMLNDRKELNKKIDEVNKKWEEIHKNAEIEKKKLISSYVQEAQEIVETIKNKQKENYESNNFEIFKLNKKLSHLDFTNEIKRDFSKAQGDIEVGCHVLIKSMNVTATALEISQNRKECLVKNGQVSIWVKMSDLEKIETKTNNNDLNIYKKPVERIRDINNQVFNNQLNLLGLTQLEAINELDQYIESALTHGVYNVKIIHGKGTGALKSAVHKYLKESYNVKSFRLGQYNEGDSGVTIVELK